MDENSCVVDGVKLVAAPCSGCDGCYFMHMEKCTRDAAGGFGVERAPCTAGWRTDRRSVIWLRADTQPSDGWTDMPQLPEVAGVCEVEMKHGGKWLSWFDGAAFKGTQTDAEQCRQHCPSGGNNETRNVLRWCMVAPDKPAASHVTAEEKQALVTPGDFDTNCWDCNEPYKMALQKCPHCGATNANHDYETAKREMGRETESDAAGIASFVPPPEVVAEPEVVRVSTRETDWAWMWRFR